MSIADPTQNHARSLSSRKAASTVGWLKRSRDLFITPTQSRFMHVHNDDAQYGIADYIIVDAFTTPASSDVSEDLDKLKLWQQIINTRRQNPSTKFRDEAIVEKWGFHFGVASKTGIYTLARTSAASEFVEKSRAWDEPRGESETLFLLATEAEEAAKSAAPPEDAGFQAQPCTCEPRYQASDISVRRVLSAQADGDRRDVARLLQDDELRREISMRVVESFADIGYRWVDRSRLLPSNAVVFDGDRITWCDNELAETIVRELNVAIMLAQDVLESIFLDIRNFLSIGSLHGDWGRLKFDGGNIIMTPNDDE